MIVGLLTSKLSNEDNDSSTMLYILGCTLAAFIPAIAGFTASYIDHARLNKKAQRADNDEQRNLILEKKERRAGVIAAATVTMIITGMLMFLGELVGVLADSDNDTGLIIGQSIAGSLVSLYALFLLYSSKREHDGNDNENISLLNSDHGLQISP